MTADNQANSVPGAREVAAAVRRSRLLDPALRARWLGLIPYMADADRAELWRILTQSESELERLDAPPGEPDSGPSEARSGEAGDVPDDSPDDSTGGRRDALR